MSFSELASANKDDTVLAIKRKYLNSTRRQAAEETRRQGVEEGSKTPLPQKNAQSKENREKYYESPSRYMSSIGQSTMKNSFQETAKESDESKPLMRDYMTLKAEYTSKNRNKSVITNVKSSFETNYGNENQFKENGGIRRQTNRTNKENGRTYGATNQDEALGKKWSRERSLRTKELEQIQSERANQGRALKEMNHKVISEIQEMLLRIKNNLKERS